jgi:hypothetical protein
VLNPARKGKIWPIFFWQSTFNLSFGEVFYFVEKQDLNQRLSSLIGRKKVIKMNLKEKQTKPKFVNNEYFDTENFPQVVGFCDIDIKSHKTGKDFESYEYFLGKKRVYKLIKQKEHWDIYEYINGKVYAISDGKNLGIALFNALTLSSNNDRKRGNMIFPVKPEKKQEALFCLYYFGGYSGYWLSDGLECEFRGKFQIPKEIPIISLSGIPWDYMQWMINILKERGIFERELVYFWNDPRLKNLKKK